MGGRKVVAYFNFDTDRQSELVVKVAFSATSTAGALKNLQAEATQKSFEQLVTEAEENWNRQLSLFEIEGTPDQKAMFYTSLYHTMINPSVYMDVDGSYRGLDHNTHQAQGFTNYTIFSLWDTYRAEHPLLNLIQPDRNADMVTSMIRHEQQSVHGMLPVWSLMGNENWCRVRTGRRHRQRQLCPYRRSPSCHDQHLDGALLRRTGSLYEAGLRAPRTKRHRGFHYTGICL